MLEEKDFQTFVNDFARLFNAKVKAETEADAIVVYHVIALDGNEVGTFWFEHDGSLTWQGTN